MPFEWHFTSTHSLLCCPNRALAFPYCVSTGSYARDRQAAWPLRRTPGVSNIRLALIQHFSHAPAVAGAVLYFPSEA